MDTTQNQPETSDPKLADPKLATLFDRKLYQQDAVVLDSLMVAAATCQSIQEFEKELR